MRHLLILLAVAMLFIQMRGRSQTTIEEYNYITKGYQIQLESGLDMKKGYRLEDVTESRVTMAGDSSYRKTVFKALYREGETTPAAIMCIYSFVINGKTVNTDYLCIPQAESSKEIWSMVYTKISEYKGEASNALTLGLMYLSSHNSKKRD
jgi:hypothetical protein